MLSEKEKLNDLFLPEGISQVSFNHDFSQVALSKRDNKIYIYSIPILLKTKTWKLLYKLENHSQYISGLDWCPETNKILSCSYDKTSFVWEIIDNKWVSSNVLFNTKLGYLCCKWNKRGDKFCEGTSSKELIIGYFDKKTKCWMGKNINVHESSVVTCEIDPTSLFVLSGSSDLSIYISSCYIPEIDDNFLTQKSKELAKEFGQIIYEFKENSWINAVTWLNENIGLVSSHDAIISVINPFEQKSDVIRCNHSPTTMLIPINEKSFYAICYDRNIFEYEKKENRWEVIQQITTKDNFIDINNKENEGKKEKKFDISEVIKICNFKNRHRIKNENETLKIKQQPYLHKSLISSANIINKNLMITTDLSGFVKFWDLKESI